MGGPYTEETINKRYGASIEKYRNINFKCLESDG